MSQNSSSYFKQEARDWGDNTLLVKHTTAPHLRDLDLLVSELPPLGQGNIKAIELEKQQWAGHTCR